MKNFNSKPSYIKNLKQVLSGFCIPYTEEIENYIDLWYPNVIAIDNYVRKLIKDHLENYKD